MNKIFLFFSLLFSLAAHALTPAELTAQLQSPAHLQGEFHQTRHLPNLATPLASHGRFVLVPGKLLLWQMETPFALTLRVRADGIAQQDANGHWQTSRQSGQEMQVRLFMALLGGDVAALEEQFALQLTGNADAWQLRLVPQSALMQQIFAHITLSGDSVVREVVLEETRGDRTLLRFDPVDTQSPLPPLALENLP
ncbi:MAG: outer membrane lipoprotein carrier protein LolA [Cardiobacteriaceae bacterium]|nr:outer membrane lipoprotein carrier protein LolA [Cardiobacteriaceae bacterium]